MYRLTPWVLRLIVANVVVYLITWASPTVYDLLTLFPGYVLQRPWTLVTYMFLHSQSDPFHLLLNMLALFFFGPRLEDRLGGRHFLALYFLSGIFGGLLSVVLASDAGGVVGASGAVMGVTAAYARYWPWDRIYIWGILPMTAWFMVLALAVYSIWSGVHTILTGVSNGVADFAHLGGLAAGWLYGWGYDRRRRNAWAPTRKQPRLSSGAGRARVERWQRIRPETLHELNRAEVERVLAKLRDQGPASLTQIERELLDRFTPP